MPCPYRPLLRLSQRMPTNLRYGQVQLSAMNWPFFVAETLGLFAAENLTVERNIFTPPPPPPPAPIKSQNPN